MQLQRTFIIGDPWLYFKIYCGVRSSDHILVDVIHPLTKKLKQENYIDQWFFIRYNDPEYHIRIRFHLTDIQHIGTVIAQFNNAITPYIHNHFIHKIQTDTYKREIERYGVDTMELSEQLFYYQSESILNHIISRQDDATYFLKTIQEIDTLLDNFQLSNDDKLTFAISGTNSFKKEFEIDSKTAKQFYKKFEMLQGQFLELRNEPFKTTKFYQKLLAQIQKANKRNPHYLLSSYVHMLVNRAFRSEQRFYELLCYDFLSRHYKYVKYKQDK